MNRLYWVTAIVLTLGAFAGTAYVYGDLPAQVPTHWNIRGEVDQTSPKGFGAFLMPIVMVIMLGVFWAIPWLSPKPFSVDSFRTTFLFVMTVTMSLFAYIQFLTMYASLHPRIDVARAMIGGIGLMFAALGNVMGRIKRNFYMGVKTPWTLASDRVWNDTHRVAAWSFVGAGILMFVIAVVHLPIWLAIIPMFPASLGPVFYSLFHYKALERAGKLDLAEPLEAA